jgi:flagellar hook-basal body complex protein FliE
MTTPSVAANAYAALSKLTIAPGITPRDGEAGAESFGAFLKSTLGKGIDGAKAAEEGAASLASGKGDLLDAVTAVSESEVALETLVNVRDRVIQAYEEIMRMPI